MTVLSVLAGFMVVRLWANEKVSMKVRAQIRVKIALSIGSSNRGVDACSGVLMRRDWPGWRRRRSGS